MATNNAVNASSQGTLYNNGTGTISGIDASTAGKVLTSNGTGVAPSFQTASAGSGGWVLLLSSAVTSQTDVVFNNTYISSTYKGYFLEASGSWDASQSTSMALYLSSDNGSTYKSTLYVGEYVQVATGTVTGNALTSSLGFITASSSKYFNFQGFVYGMNQTSLPITSAWTSGASTSANSAHSMVHGSGIYPAGTAMNTFKFNSANAFTGTFNLYGILA